MPRAELRRKSDVKSTATIVAAGFGVAAAIAAFGFWLRTTPPSTDASPSREPMKASDRVRARLEQLQMEHPDWGKAQETGALHARLGLQAAPQHGSQAPRGLVQQRAVPPDTAATPQADAPDDLLDDADDIPAMKKLALEDKDPDRRLAAVTMLGASEDPEAIPALAQALSDSDEEVRMAALQALSDFTDEPPVEAIESALNDPAPDIRFEALSVLADIGGERLRTAIESALNDPDEDVRNLAEGILDLEETYEPPPSTPAAGARHTAPE